MRCPICNGEMENGYVQFHRGLAWVKNKHKISLAALKYEISRGVPVIVGMEIAPGNSLLHFLPIVGYDDEYIYAAESVGIYANEKGDHYNRKIKTDTFKELWKTDGHNHKVAIRVVRK